MVKFPLFWLKDEGRNNIRFFFLLIYSPKRAITSPFPTSSVIPSHHIHPAILPQPCHLCAKEHRPALLQNFTKEQEGFTQQSDPSLTYKDI